jgi:lipopolysaccharide export system protein LptA
VLVTRGEQSARGDVAIYDFNRRIITLAGNVQLLRGSDNLSGGRLVIDLASGLSSVDGSAGGSSSALGTSTGSGGRVSGSFAVPKKN